MSNVITVVEGRTDVPFVLAILNAVGRVGHPVIVKRGYSALDRDLRNRWNSSSNTRPMLVLRDFDPHPDDTSCPPLAVAALTGGRLLAPRLAVRLAVEELEAWALADAEALKSFFHLQAPPPPYPDDLADPKQELINRCRRSRSSEIRNGMVPRQGGQRSVGPEYEAMLIRYGECWSPTRAAKRSPSLARTLVRLEQLVSDGVW